MSTSSAPTSSTPAKAIATKQPPADRRMLSFKSSDAVLADVRQLRSAGYRQLGNWTLPQILQHLTATMNYSLKKPPTDVPTPEQAARKEQFFSLVFNGMPLDTPAPSTVQPTADAGDEQFDRFEKAFFEVDAWPHPTAEVGRCGPVVMEDVRKLHRAHAAHHLSMLIPNTGPRPRPVFNSEADAIAEIERLRRGGYTQAGDWSLAQIAHHCLVPMQGSLKQPSSTEPTPEQVEASKFVDLVNANGWPTQTIPAGGPMIPPADVPDTEIDALIAALRALAVYPNSHVSNAFLGPIDTPRIRRFVLAHLAHHLAFLRPKLKRRDGLSYADEDAAIADIERLRRGYSQAGNWTLPQACWHLNFGVESRMKPGPFPPNTPEQEARQAIVKKVLADGQLPDGIVAPETMIPPVDASEAEIDTCIATLRAFKQYNGPIPPHRLFGHLSDADARRLNLIHFARHLSYFTEWSGPGGQGSAKT